MYVILSQNLIPTFQNIIAMVDMFSYIIIPYENQSKCLKMSVNKWHTIVVNFYEVYICDYMKSKSKSELKKLKIKMY